MKFNKNVLNILNLLSKTGQLNKSVLVYKNSFSIDRLLKITPENIVLNNTLNLQEKIMVRPLSSENSFDIVKSKKLISKLEKYIVRLNHVGINYSCKNIQEELKGYKSILTNSNFYLYEEDSGNTKNRWFFVGNADIWENPLFEIVLTENDNNIVNDWVPHFQIDVDTNLSYEEIEIFTEKTFDSNFLNWKLEIPNYGVVLTMGNLGEISNTKIYLGIGTKLRNTKYHRRNILKTLS